MRIEIDIPKEFEKHFKQDKFKDSLERIMADIKHSLENGDCLCAGRYEHETIEMLQKAFEDSKSAYDVDKVVEYLELHSFEFGTDTLPAHYVRLNDAIEIVKQEAERCNSGWILCSERFPDECVPVNVTYINRNPEPYYAKIKDVPFSATAVYYNGKWYWYSSACVDYLTEYGKNDFDLVDKDIDIIAWMELPSAYIPKEK